MLEYHEEPPRAALRQVLECVWEVRDPRARQERPADRVVPDGCPELIVHLADPFKRRVSGRWRTQAPAFLAGTLSRPVSGSTLRR